MPLTVASLAYDLTLSPRSPFALSLRIRVLQLVSGGL